MKIKLVLDINKTQQAQLNAVVTGRQGDKATVTVNVFVVDAGVPCNLTGQDIYYEGLKPNNAYVRDKTGVKMINATQGNFEYTFRPETFGVAGVGRRSYFSIEQGGTVRASTQDFGLVTLGDAMTGHTMSGPYISELEQLIQEAQWLVNDINSRWTSINSQLTQLQNKLNGMDVVKRSGDTMTGKLWFSGASKGIAWQENSKEVADLIYNGRNIFLRGKPVDGTIYNAVTYDIDKNYFNVQSETNLLKKTGDTAIGHMLFRHNINQETSDGLKGVNMVVNTSVNKWSVAPKIDGNPVWANEMAMDLTSGKLTVASLATKKDGRASLTLTADATAGSSNPQLATRRGNTVTVNLDLQRNTGATGLIVANLPADMLPVDSYTFDAIATDGTPSRVLIRFNGEIHLDTAGKRYRILTTFVTN